MARTLTTANSIFTLLIPGLYNAPVPLQGYATDSSFMAEDIKPAEVQMGVDGKLSGGYVPQEYPVSIELQADSLSNIVFDTWQLTQQMSKEVFTVNGIIILQGTFEKYFMNNGFLTSYSPMPASKKILQSRKFTITFESITKSPV